MRRLGLSTAALASAAFGLMFAALEVGKGWWNTPSRHVDNRIAVSRRVRGKSTRDSHTKPDHRSRRRKAAARSKQRRLRA